MNVGHREREHTTSVTRLQHVQCAPHIPFTEPDQAVNCIGLDVHGFLLDHEIDQLPDIRLFQRAEAEPCASG